MKKNTQSEIIEYLRRILSEEDDSILIKKSEISRVLDTFAALNDDIELPNKIRSLSSNLTEDTFSATEIRESIKSILEDWDAYYFRINNHKSVIESSKEGIIITIVTVTISLISLIVGDEGLSKYIGKSIDTESTSNFNPSLFWLTLLQFVFLLFFVIFTFSKNGTYKISEERLNNSRLHLVFKQFSTGWRFLWIAWAALYLWFSLWWGNIIKISTELGWAVADTLNGLTAFCFFNLFIIMDLPSYNTSEFPNRKRKFNMFRTLYLALCITVALISIIGRYDWIDHIGNGGSIVLSIIVAISMMHFFGRLDSTYLNINRLALIPFYLYAAIQVTWNSFENNPGLMLFIFFLAFVLKISVATSVTVWLKSGNFEEYFLHVPKAYERAQKNLNDQ